MNNSNKYPFNENNSKSSVIEIDPKYGSLKTQLLNENEEKPNSFKIANLLKNSNISSNILPDTIPQKISENSLLDPKDFIFDDNLKG